jgi:methionine-rich copper-binding protein CopC
MARASIAIGRPKRAGARRPRSWGRRPHNLARLCIEPLEVRSLLSASTPVDSPPEFPPNETIDLAWDLGTPSQPETTVGSVGTGPYGAADVTWYHFQLDEAARVDLTVRPPAGDSPFASVLSLFNNDPLDWGDPYNLDGHRLLAQVQAGAQDGIASYQQDLGPGDYYVAISGGGNTAFSPVLAGSGLQGTMGAYELTVGATDLGLADDGPMMLWSDPAAGAVLDASPLAIRVEMSGPLDPGTIVPGQTVQLLSVSDGVETPVALASVNFSSAANELQLFPLSPLAPGRYLVQLSGDSSGGQSVLASPGDVPLPLGQDAGHPAGTDESFGFSVAGIDGVAGATTSDDTAATARDLGDLAHSGIVQVAGAIGVDPAFNPNLAPDPTNPDPPDNPANQVNLYHFRITGPGNYAMLAEVFAGRIGSTLDPGLSLWERDPSDGHLILIAGNNNTLDPAKGTDGSFPLFTDSYIGVPLAAGDYYLAVAGGANTPSPIEGQLPGSPGIFDPNQPGSAQLGWSTGPYILNVMVRPATQPPQVVASSPSPNQVLGQAPTQLTVQFSEPVDLQQLAYQTYETSYSTVMPQVFVEGTDGTRYNVRLVGYDRATNTATFQMLDGLPNGRYTLHLSGPAGVTDLGGDPLPGNDPSGDYVIPFAVQGAFRGLEGGMAVGYTIASAAAQGVPQQIGVLFPDELQAGVNIVRFPESPTDPGASETSDTYVIQVLQYQNYSFQLTGDNLPDGTQLTLTDASGQTVPLTQSEGGQLSLGLLKAGTYTLSVGGWSADEAAGVSYQVLILLNGQQDNAPPLVDGPAPALQVALAPSAGLSEAPLDASTAAVGTGGGGLSVVGPIAGVASSTGPGAVAAVAGLAGSTGAVAAETGSASSTTTTSVALASNLAQTEAAGGLSGLALGPLGGSGGQTTSVAAPTVQVALNVPSNAGPASNSLAVSLVTLTQTFSWSHQGDGDGEGIVPVESPEPPGDAVSGLPAADETGSAGAQAEPRNGSPVPTPAADRSSARPVGPTPALVVPLEFPVVSAPAGPQPTEAAAEATPATAVAVADPLGSESRAARWTIAAATFAAVYRGRTVFRGLGWRKKTSRGAGRS